MTTTAIVTITAVLGGALILSGCAIRPRAKTTKTWAAPDDTSIPGVTNLGKVTPDFWRGSQPTAEGFANLERAGVKTIINLRSDHDDLPLLAETKLKYIRIPMRAWNPNQGDDAQIALVLKSINRLLADPAACPIYIHCAQGRDRTGYSVATYRRVAQAWPATDAVLEMFDYRFNTLWFRNPRFIRNLDIQRMTQLIERAP
jgi:protein tyrosine/serine phosphatase